MPTLTSIQAKAFTDLFDVYAPSRRAALANKRESGLVYSRVGQNIPCRVMSKVEASKDSPVGRMNVDQMDTTDVIRFHEDEVVGDGYYLKRVGSGHPEIGEWLLIQGGPKNMSFKAKTKTFLCVKATRPPLT
jgi:hypothetical protein